MKRYVLRLLGIALLIAITPWVILALGYSWTAAVLGTILATALTWAPVLLTLEHMTRIRRLEELRLEYLRARQGEHDA
jgi:hypothetical protein